MNNSGKFKEISSSSKWEMVKVATLEFCSIQKHFIRDIRAKFYIPNSPQSPDIGQNSDGGICDFRVSS